MVNSTFAHRYCSFPLAGDKCQKRAVHVRMQWWNRKTVIYCDKQKEIPVPQLELEQHPWLWCSQEGGGKKPHKAMSPSNWTEISHCLFAVSLQSAQRQKNTPGIVAYMLIGHVPPERIFSFLVRLKSFGERAKRMQINISLFISLGYIVLHYWRGWACRLACTHLRTEETW